jgi:glycerol-3-phosphate dehydrogenase (NAD(P)+)
MTQRIVLLGGGGMATACALVLAENPDHEVVLWCRRTDAACEIAKSRINPHLPGGRLPDSVEVTADPACVANADWIVVAVPTKYLRETITPLGKYVGKDIPVVSVVKGLELGTLERPSEIILEALGERGIVVLSGPSHAEEIAQRKPATLVAASQDIRLARQVQELFTTDRFRVYANADIVGVEYAGAIKNVIAIAAGICEGLDCGDNAKAALLARGIAEMTRLGVSLGAEAATFAGLAGIGDLITTCISPHGRNRQVGLRLGQGETLDAIQSSMTNVAEGVNAARPIQAIARSRGVETPIIDEVCEVLFEGKTAIEATRSLMQRPMKDE